MQISFIQNQLHFFRSIISEQQFCKFLTFNIEFFKSYNFSKILLVFSLFIKLKNFFRIKIVIKFQSKTILTLQTLKLIIFFILIDGFFGNKNVN